MKFHKAWVATGFALALLSAPATAADWGGIKEIGGDIPIPVPAPAPVPTYDIYSDWYVGFAIGANVLQDATITDTDIDYLGDQHPGHFARDSGDIGASPIFGLNFGRYITPSLRAEIAIDYTPDAQISRSRASDYEVNRSAMNFATGRYRYQVYGVSRTDTVKLSRTTGLVNLLYDIPTGTRFTPYIGGGVGFSWRRIAPELFRRVLLHLEESLCSPAACSPTSAPRSASPCRVQARKSSSISRPPFRRASPTTSRIRSSGTTAGRCFGRAAQLHPSPRRPPARTRSSIRTPSCSNSAPASASSLTESCAPLLSVPKKAVDLAAFFVARMSC